MICKPPVPRLAYAFDIRQRIDLSCREGLPLFRSSEMDLSLRVDGVVGVFKKGAGCGTRGGESSYLYVQLFRCQRVYERLSWASANPDPTPTVARQSFTQLATPFPWPFSLLDNALALTPSVQAGDTLPVIASPLPNVRSPPPHFTASITFNLTPTTAPNQHATLNPSIHPSIIPSASVPQAKTARPPGLGLRHL
jgi:hypothetical protein